jgi:2-hydroxy-3-keto-5-methylthiopentenyl-1-phosphate phosphatase
MFETLMENNFSVYLLRDMDGDITEKDVEDLMVKFKEIPVKFATVDLGYMSLREFNETHLAKVFNEFEIPYFTVELPHFVQGHFSGQISQIQNKYNELKASYDLLKDKNTPGAQELSYLIEYYSNELRELNHYINQQIRVDSITQKILSVIKDRDSRDLTFVHVGEENTLVEIMRQLKEHDVKSNILFIQKSKFLL